ncbi:hypothetical protein OH77DRAFT_1134162 [Trametes cingulata]|nr:hypothetical protein OH77DRAFT_1134162 [Trametes cingulata]
MPYSFEMDPASRLHSSALLPLCTRPIVVRTWNLSTTCVGDAHQPYKRTGAMWMRTRQRQHDTHPETLTRTSIVRLYRRKQAQRWICFRGILAATSPCHQLVVSGWMLRVLREASPNGCIQQRNVCGNITTDCLLHPRFIGPSEVAGAWRFRKSPLTWHSRMLRPEASAQVQNATFELAARNQYAFAPRRVV